MRFAAARAAMITDDVTVRGPAAPAPARRPGSVRRTTSIDATFPEGFGGAMRFDGRARDLVTRGDGPPDVLRADRIDVVTSAAREIRSISVEPGRGGVGSGRGRGIGSLVGVRAGGGLRKAVRTALSDEPADSTLHLLLDDLGGASLVAGFAWSRWTDLVPDYAEAVKQHARPMVGICSGFRVGSSGLTPQGTSRWSQDVRPVPPLGSDDPDCWHELPQLDEVSHRRARRIDVWADGDELWVDAHFQDSLTEPGGGRVAVHEYLVAVRADRATHELTFLSADPRVLPYAECPLAVRNVDLLLGQPLERLRDVVLERLPGTLGCTHLNDVFRSLADVPALALALN